VVVLRYVEDLTEAQTAATLGVALGTVKSTNARALQKLRSAPELSGSYAGEQS
jgi:DNA-directed RNA polymerase specialized sigma24 family protein